MVELHTSYSLSQVPYSTNEALEEYVESIIHDYSPERLYTPGAFDIDHFLEYYIGLEIDFRHIHHERKILGMTIFYDTLIDVLNIDTNQPETIFLKKGTIIIDTLLALKRNNKKRRFITAHECAHWLLHRKALAPNNPFGYIGAFQNQYMAAKTGKVDYSRSENERDDVERMERQADFLASAILMPRPALRKTYKDFFKTKNEKVRVLEKGGTNSQDDEYIKELTKYVSDIYDVSQRAALIRLEKLGAIKVKQ
jgi:Zn-dependent peptidase ImmA (M78 family)